MTKRDVDKSALAAPELLAIKDKPFNIERLAIVRDIFVFCCFTGLAYADIEKLKRCEIGIGIDGENWIYTSR